MKKKIIYFQEFDSILISLSHNSKIELFYIVFILKYKLNLIFFGQLQDTNFINYY